MKQRLARLLILLIWCLAMARPCEAVFFPGGGDLPVIDRTNLAQNVLSAIRLLHQIKNSDQEVDMMIKNLLPLLGQPAYNLAQFEGLLIALSQGAGPRAWSAFVLDYFKNNLQAAMQEFYVGYTPLEEPIYPNLYGRNADMGLNTIESILSQTNVIAGLASDLRYDGDREALRSKNAGSIGNLQAQHTGNAITLFAADGIRRTEKSLAGIANLIAARDAHDLQKEAWSEIMTRTAMELAGPNEPPPLYNGGAGGVKYIAAYQGAGGF